MCIVLLFLFLFLFFVLFLVGQSIVPGPPGQAAHSTCSSCSQECLRGKNAYVVRMLT